MTEVKTQPVTAVLFDDKQVHRANKIPGSVCIMPPDPTTPDGEEPNQFLWYYCPCGCGSLGVLIVGCRYKPKNDGFATWKWDGRRDKPTLVPSVHHVGHWHGYLTDGVWKSV